jgi:hypothetical protein
MTPMTMASAAIQTSRTPAVKSPFCMTPSRPSSRALRRMVSYLFL